MVNKITNAVLAEKISNVHTTVNSIESTLFKEIKPAIKANTDFRNQAKGFYAAFIFIAGSIGGIAVWLISKFSELFTK